MKECTCLGSCRGAKGLGPGWKCALRDSGTTPDIRADVDLLQTMDGVIWAREFCRVTGFQDEEMARAWFCNAIMCGWDHHYRTTPEYKAMVADALAASSDAGASQ